mmetsp:Transcript_34339/g.74136  ORF Transcript_34339/g.74136 Transcript_34339/m.74136 type:complete len:175 (-) Transcript_34339:835-1359(-)
MLFLGDISGSMSSRMPFLHRAMISKLEEAHAKGFAIGFQAWHSHPVWSPEGARLYAPGDDVTRLKAWITSLSATGGNQMRAAIEHAMAQVPSVTDVIICCDGDITPFTISGGQEAGFVDGEAGQTNWKAFASRYRTGRPDQPRFHFVAFEKGADKAQMQLMAQLGGGDFEEVSG